MCRTVGQNYGGSGAWVDAIDELSLDHPLDFGHLRLSFIGGDFGGDLVVDHEVVHFVHLLAGHVVGGQTGCSVGGENGSGFGNLVVDERGVDSKDTEGEKCNDGCNDYAYADLEIRGHGGLRSCCDYVNANRRARVGASRSASRSQPCKKCAARASPHAR